MIRVSLRLMARLSTQVGEDGVERIFSGRPVLHEGLNGFKI